ncbi:MAG: sigma-E factor negative regulatory protein [Burkholderiales bacterium]
MKTEVSALMDGELDQSAAKSLITRLQSDQELQRCWNVYHQIGDCLRREHIPDNSLQQKIFAGLQAEPTVLAPRPRNAGFIPIIATALAASVATVAVVSWLGFQSSQAPVELATTTTAQPRLDNPKFVQVKPDVGNLQVQSVALMPAVAPTTTAPEFVSQEYLFAHQEFSPTPGVLQASFGGRR